MRPVPQSKKVLAKPDKTEQSPQALAAFQKHVGAVKDSFANLSVEHADPAALATIAHSLAAVASYAHSAAQTAAACGPPPKP